MEYYGKYKREEQNGMQLVGGMKHSIRNVNK